MREQSIKETEMVEKGHYSYKKLKNNKVKYSNMSSYEQTNYMNGLYDENMGFILFISIIIVKILDCAHYNL